MRNLVLMVVLILLGGCIDLITFDTSDEPKRLVVDATITSLSYNERQHLPLPAERFTVRLAYTSEVSNQVDQTVLGAEVLLYDDKGGEWIFSDDNNTGVYMLYDDDFGVRPNHNYTLQITTQSGKVYESDSERMIEATEISPIKQEFMERQVIRELAGEEELVTVRGVEGRVDLPEISEGEKFYRWKLTAGWEVQANLLPNNDPNKRCWVTNKRYFDEFILLNDASGGFEEPLFFLSISDNSRAQYEFTTLITQYSLNESAFEFWDLIKQQAENGASIFDPQPFQITSNLRCVSNPDEKVSGYFIVADESVTRWTLVSSDIPFSVTYDDLCSPPPGAPSIPPPVCTNCLNYQSGYSFISNEKPSWWYETE